MNGINNWWTVVECWFACVLFALNEYGTRETAEEDYDKSHPTSYLTDYYQAQPLTMQQKVE
jgi:hypothetical protein